MSDYINNDIPVADGTTYGVPPNTTTLYPWMSVKAGGTSYFGEVRMRGDIYDKEDRLIEGSTVSGIHNTTCTLELYNSVQLWIFPPLAQLNFYNPPGTVTRYNVGSSSEVYSATPSFTFSGPAKNVHFTFTFNFRVSLNSNPDRTNLEFYIKNNVDTPIRVCVVSVLASGKEQSVTFQRTLRNTVPRDYNILLRNGSNTDNFDIVITSAFATSQILDPEV